MTGTRCGDVPVGWETALSPGKIRSIMFQLVKDSDRTQLIKSDVHSSMEIVIQSTLTMSERRSKHMRVTSTYSRASCLHTIWLGSLHVHIQHHSNHARKCHNPKLFLASMQAYVQSCHSFPSQVHVDAINTMPECKTLKPTSPCTQIQDIYV